MLPSYVATHTAAPDCVGHPRPQVTEDAAAETPPADALQEGGSDLSARRCTFLDLALSLAAGVDASGAGTLFKAARAGLAERDASVQKKAYKVASHRGVDDQTVVALPCL